MDNPRSYQYDYEDCIRSDDVAEQLVPWVIAEAARIARSRRITGEPYYEFLQMCQLEAVKVVRRETRRNPDDPPSAARLTALLRVRLNGLSLDQGRARRPRGYRSSKKRDEGHPVVLRCSDLSESRDHMEAIIPDPVPEPHEELARLEGLDDLIERIGLGHPFPDFARALALMDRPDIRAACESVGIPTARGNQLIEDARDVLAQRPEDFPGLAGFFEALL